MRVLQLKQFLFLPLFAVWFSYFISVQNGFSATNDLPVLTRLDQVRKLDSEEAAKGYPVHIAKAVVTFTTTSNRGIFLQDDFEAVYVTGKKSNIGLKMGQLVEVNAVTAKGGVTTTLSNPSYRILSQNVPLPEPKRVDLGRLTSTEEDCRWLEITGIIRSLGPLDDSVEFEITDNTNTNSAKCTLVNARGTKIHSVKLLDARMRARGVAFTRSDGKGGFFGVLACPSLEYIDFLESGAALDEAKLVDPAAFEKLAQSKASTGRVRVRGQVASQLSEREFQVDNQGHQITIQCTQSTPPKKGDYIEAIGVPMMAGDKAILGYCIVKPLGLNLNSSSTKQTAPDSKPKTDDFLPILTQVSEVRALPAEELVKGYPARIRGVVTFIHQIDGWLFVNDESDGIFISPKTYTTVEPGQLVEVTGYSNPGQYAPIINQAEITILGSANLPTPRHPKWNMMALGQEDAQWVQLTGIIQQVERKENEIILTVAVEGNPIPVIIQAPATVVPDPAWIDAQATITGVCGTIFNEKREIEGVNLLVPGLKYVEILQPGNVNPFTQTVLAINKAARFNQHVTSEHRIRLQGVVTYIQPGVRLVIKDATGSVIVEPVEQENARVGDRVDAVGFPRWKDQCFTLNAARVKRLGPGNPPIPMVIGTNQLSDRTLHSELVRIQGVFLGCFHRVNETRLVVQFGDSSCEAKLFGTNAPPRWNHIPPGSLLELTGICVFNANSIESGANFDLLLRNSNDIEVLQLGSWWTPERTIAAVCLGLLIAIAIYFRLRDLRKRVSLQNDVIRRKTASERALEARYQLIWETSVDGMRTMDEHGLVIEVNEAYCQMVKKRREEIEGHPYVDVYVERARAHMLEAYQAHCRERKIKEHQETELTLWNGRRVWFELSNSFCEQPGHPPMVLSILRDISHRKSLEDQLRTAQKMEAIGQLAGGVAHDFNNILTVIQGYTGMLQTDSRIPEDLAEPVKEVAASAKRAADLTAQLLAFSRRQVLKVRPLNLNDAITNITKMLRRLLGEHVMLDVQCAPTLPMITADSTMMEQILINLSVNARDAMPKGGTLKIATSSVTVNSDILHSNPDARTGQFVRLDVYDTGCGMDSATLKHIFEPFFTTKELGKGTGLGLATVYGVVKQHEGWLEVESTPGKGTHFAIYLPVGTNGHAVQETSEARHQAHTGHETILVVEDDDQLRFFATIWLKRQGYQMLAAANGPEAIRIWEQNRDSIRLLITDLVMPHGMSGRELAERFKKDKPGLVVLFSSGYNVDSQHHGLDLQEGVNFLPKPYEPSRMAAIVRKCLDRQPV